MNNLKFNEIEIIDIKYALITKSRILKERIEKYQKKLNETEEYKQYYKTTIESMQKDKKRYEQIISKIERR